MSQFTNLHTDEQKMLLLLARQLLDHARAAKAIEEYDDGAWCHSAECPGACDYACGAIWIGYRGNADGEIVAVTELQNGGTLRVELPGAGATSEGERGDTNAEVADVPS